MILSGMDQQMLSLAIQLGDDLRKANDLRTRTKNRGDLQTSTSSEVA